MTDTNEERLVAFSKAIITLCREISAERILIPLAGQLLRSGTSAALNYGEARGASSRRDFIHKLNLVIKELRETHVNLRIVDQSVPIKSQALLLHTIDECNQLISIFVKSVNTAKANEERRASSE